MVAMSLIFMSIISKNKAQKFYVCKFEWEARTKLYQALTFYHINLDRCNDVVTR